MSRSHRVQRKDKKNLPDKNFITVKEAAELASYTTAHVSRLLRQGKIDAKKIGRKRFVQKDSLENFLVAIKERKEKQAQKLREQLAAERGVKTESAITKKITSSSSVQEEVTRQQPKSYSVAHLPTMLEAAAVTLCLSLLLIVGFIGTRAHPGLTDFGGGIGQMFSALKNSVAIVDDLNKELSLSQDMPAAAYSALGRYVDDIWCGVNLFLDPNFQCYEADVVQVATGADNIRIVNPVTTTTSTGAVVPNVQNITNQYITNPIREVVKETVVRDTVRDVVTQTQLSHQNDASYQSLDSLRQSIDESIHTGSLTVSGITTLASTTATALGVSGNLGVDGYATAAYFVAGNSAGISTFAGSLTVGTTSAKSTLTVDGDIYIASSSVPGTTTDRLYNSGGDIYWSGELLSGPSVAVWGSDGTDAWRTSGNVGIGTSTLSQLFTVGSTAGSQFLVNSSGTVVGGVWNAGAVTSSSTVTGTKFVTSSSTATSTFANIYSSGDVHVAGSLRVDVDSTVFGNSTVIGSSTTGTLTINSRIDSDVIPKINASYDLGSASLYWGNLYVDTITANSIGAASTTISGTQSANFTLNSDNATADTEDINLIFYRGTVVPNALITWDSTRDRFDINQPFFIQNDSSSTTIQTLALKGTSGQTADIFNVSDFSSNPLFNVTAAGKVGIGTSSPSLTLAIDATDGLLLPVGTNAQRPTGATGIIRYNTDTAQFEGYSSGAWQGLGGVIDVDQDTYITAEQSADEDYLRFFTFGNERMTIGSTGNVGIGTTSPIAKFAVAGDAYIGGNLTATGTINLASTTLAYQIGGINILKNNFTSDSLSLGEGAGNAFNDTGLQNVAIGYQAAYDSGSTTASSYLSALGFRSAYQNTGANLTATGYYSALLNSGDSVTAFGSNTAYQNSGSNVTASGDQSSYLNSGSDVTTSGTYSGFVNSGSNVSAFGVYSAAGNTSDFVSAFGNNTLRYIASSNAATVFGYQAGRGDTGGATVANLTAFGYQAGLNLQTGADNNLLIGYQAGDALTTGSDNILIGYNVDASSVTASNELNIGNTLYGDLSAGYVGIGTSSPIAKLAVAGDTYLGGNLTATGTLSILGNTSLANFTAVNATTTSATSTNLFATKSVFTSATTTNLALTGITSSLLYANANGALIATTSISSNLIEDTYLLNTGDTTTGNLVFNDNVKALFGTGSDASIYYDGSNFIFNSQEVGGGHYEFNNGTVNANSQLTVGNPTNGTGMLTVNGNIDFDSGANRTFSVTSAASGNGDNLSIFAGAGHVGLAENNDGGDLLLYGGNNYGSGVVGDVILAHTGSVARGNVGIGTSSPGAKLDVAGGILLSSSSAEAAYHTGLQRLSGGETVLWYGGGANGLYFKTGATGSSGDRMVLTSGGSLGIGTTSPSSKLTVAGDAYITGALYDNSNSAGTNGYVLQTTGTGFSWVATSTLGITSGSSVSFGTDNQIPYTNAGGTDFDYSSNFTYDGTALNVNDSIVINNSGNNGVLTVNAFSGQARTTYTDSDWGTSWSVGSEGDVAANFVISHSSSLSTSQRLVIDPTGFIGIGTSSPTSKLDVWGSLTVGTSSTPTLFTDASTNRVGIGTSTPFEALTVDGNAYVAGNATTTGDTYIGGAATADTLTVHGFSVDTVGRIVVSASNSGISNSISLNNTAATVGAGNRIGFNNASGVYGYIQNAVESTGAGYLSFGTRESASAVERLRISAAGNIGIGTSSPASKLDVWGDTLISTSSATAFAVHDDLSNTVLAVDTTNSDNDLSTVTISNKEISISGAGRELTLGIETSGSVRSYVTSRSGRDFFIQEGTTPFFYYDGDGTDYIGIGTSSPASKLDVWGSLTVGTSSTPALKVDTANNQVFFTSGSQAAPGLALYDDPDTGFYSTGSGLVVASGGSPSVVFSASGLTTGVAGGAQIKDTGTAAAPSFTFHSRTDLGMYAATADSLGFATVGTERLLIDINGNVGIGTSSPASKLDVWGDLRVGTSSIPALFAQTSTGYVGIGTSTPGSTLDVDGTVTISGASNFLALGGNTINNTGSGSTGLTFTSSNRAVFTVSSASSAGISISNTSGTGDASIALNAGGGVAGARIGSKYVDGSNIGLAFETRDNGTAYSEKLTILPAGNVGIGTTSPASKLDVWGDLRIGTSSTPTLFVQSSTKHVGIGTDSPSNDLTIQPSSSNNGIVIYESDDSSRKALSFTAGTAGGSFSTLVNGSSQNSFGFTSAFNQTQSLNADFTIKGYTDANLFLADTGEDAIGVGYGASDVVGTSGKLLVNGNVGIGTTSPASKLDVWGDLRVGTSSDPLIFADVSTASIGIGTSSPDASYLMTLEGAGTPGIKFINTARTDRTSHIIQDANGYLTLNSDVIMDFNITAIPRALRLSASGVSVNANSNAAGDFRVYGDTDTYLIFADAGTDNVGIGTSSPASKLDVWGSLTVGTSSTPTLFANAGNGNIGINTASSQFKLQVEGGDIRVDRQAGKFGFEANNLARAGIASNATNDLVFETGSQVEAVRILGSNGYLGVGQTAPDSPLHVEGTDGSGVGLARFANSDYVQSTVGSGLFIGTGANTGDTYTTMQAFDAGFSSTNNLVLQASGGGVGIGTAGGIDVPLKVLSSSTAVARFDRLSTDGDVILIMQGGNAEGSISVSGTTVSYNAFTGSHYGIYSGATPSRGTLMTLNGVNGNYGNRSESEIVYGVEPSSIENDSAILGAYLGIGNPSDPVSYENPALIMAVGNGEVWVADNGEDILRGDYLISSDVPGHAEKDLGTYQTAHIIARAAEDVDWDSVTDTYNGVKHVRLNVTFEVFDNYHFSDDFIALLSTGTSTKTEFSSLLETDTVWSRLVALANSFVDGVLKIAGLKTDELCVGDVCVDRDQFLAMVTSANATSTLNNSGDITTIDGTLCIGNTCVDEDSLRGVLRETNVNVIRPDTLVNQGEATSTDTSTTDNSTDSTDTSGTDQTATTTDNGIATSTDSVATGTDNGVDTATTTNDGTDIATTTDPIVEVDTTAPVISGVGSVTLTEGDSFDVLSGVSANDETDGDVDVTVTDDGGLDTNTDGSYTVSYSTVDAAGNEATVERTVTVEAVPAPEPTTTATSTESGT